MAWAAVWAVKSLVRRTCLNFSRKMKMQTSTASRRLQKEAKTLTSKDREKDVILSIVNDDLFHWKAWILGPRDTPYADGYFCLGITS